MRWLAWFGFSWGVFCFLLGFLLLNYFDRLFGCLGNCFLRGGSCFGRVVVVWGNKDLWGVDVSECLPLRQTRVYGKVFVSECCCYGKRGFCRI